MRKLMLVALLAAGLASGCTFHSTGTTEVGVVTHKFSLLGKAGVQKEIYEPGATYLFPAFVTDWHVFDVKLQNLEMVADKSRGDRQGRDDVEFKTRDGNDIAVDVTVSWRIEGSKASAVLERVGASTDEVKEKLVRPACRSLVRDVLNTMSSEEFYVSDKKFEKADEARQLLQKTLEPEGIVVERVILGEHRFHPDYEKVIHDKKLAEQTAERLVSEGKAAEQEALRNLETARGQVSQKIARAQGNLDQVKLAADADYFKAQRNAEAVLSERSAHAKGVAKQQEALAGSGGKALVKLRIAEALMGKQILFLPSGGKGGNLQTLNMNDVLARYAIASSEVPRPAAARADKSASEAEDK